MLLIHGRKIGMDKNRIPKPGEIYNQFKDKPFQIITVAAHAQTKEQMVVYQALYGDFKTYALPLELFLNGEEHGKYPQTEQDYRPEPEKAPEEPAREALPVQEVKEAAASPDIQEGKSGTSASDGEVNLLLMKFLDAKSYSKKLEVLTSNRKHLNDRLINDMAVALDCAIEEGPLDQRINGLVNCLQQLRRFEDRRLR